MTVTIMALSIELDLSHLRMVSVTSEMSGVSDLAWTECLAG